MFDVISHGGTEKHRLTSARTEAEKFRKLIGETSFENAIRLINDKNLRGPIWVRVRR